MSIQERAKAAAENVQGKAQEALGDLTGDKDLQAEGQAKQVEANARNLAEDVKDKAKKVADAVSDKARDLKKAID